MKNKKLNTKKIAIIIAVALLMGVVIFGIYKYYTMSKDNNSVSSNQPQASDKTLPDSTPVVDNSKPSEPTPTNSSNTALGLSVTGISQDSNYIYFGTIVEGTTKGECTLIASRKGQSNIETSSQITIITSYYSCGNLRLAKSQFGQKREWSYKITAKDGSNSVQKDGVFNVN